jgi:hypothetical protein
MRQNTNRCFLPVFSCKPNSFTGSGALCWPIGVTAALLGRLLPSDGPKLVNIRKNGHFGPKVLQTAHVLTRCVILNLYQEMLFREARVQIHVTFYSCGLPLATFVSKYIRHIERNNILSVTSVAPCGAEVTAGTVRLPQRATEKLFRRARIEI